MRRLVPAIGFAIFFFGCGTGREREAGPIIETPSTGGGGGAAGTGGTSGGGGTGGESAGAAGATAGAAGSEGGSAGAPQMGIWPDSATRFCTDGSHVTSCPMADGQDGDDVAPKPDYVLSSAIVFDTLTGLMWTRDFYPAQKPFDTSLPTYACTGLFYGGFGDWRLPTVSELVSILDFGDTKVSSDALFPDTPGEWFWTRSRRDRQGTPSWAVVCMADGMLGWNQRAYARCVRGVPPGRSFVVEGETAIETRTGIAWDVADAGEAATWTDALATCEALVKDGHDDWHLPTIKQATTGFRDDGRFVPAPEVFSSDGSYWTSTPLRGNASRAWRFTVGDWSGFDSAATTEQLRVRCVRRVGRPVPAPP